MDYRCSLLRNLHIDRWRSLGWGLNVDHRGSLLWDLHIDYGRRRGCRRSWGRSTGCNRGRVGGCRFLTGLWMDRSMLRLRLSLARLTGLSRDIVCNTLHCISSETGFDLIDRARASFSGKLFLCCPGLLIHRSGGHPACNSEKTYTKRLTPSI